MKKTTRKIRRDGQGVWWGLALILACGMAIALAVYQERGPKRHIEIGTAISVTPTAQPKPLSLALDLPALSDIQRHYLHETQALPRCPICFGVDKPAVGFTDSEAVVFAALLYSESMLNPYDEYGNHKVSSAGCEGISQLCFGHLTETTRNSDEEAIYEGARYFKELLDENDHDVMAATRQYKGVATDDTKWQANSIFGVLKVGG